MKKLLLFFIIILFSCIFPKQTLAQTGNFSSSADVTYTVNESGLTHVKFAVTLTNNTSTYYVSQYDLNVGFTDIQNITASDSTGKMQLQVKTDASPKIISPIFNTKTLGLGKDIPFIVEFDTSDVAKHVGKTWEVTIPGLANQNEFTDFVVHVNIPPSFGTPTYIKPQQTSKMLDFTKEQLTTSGIALGFGDAQVYTFSATYHVTNTHIFPQTAEIALPSDTNYQSDHSSL